MLLRNLPVYVLYYVNIVSILLTSCVPLVYCVFS